MKDIGLRRVKKDRGSQPIRENNGNLSGTHFLGAGQGGNVNEFILFLVVLDQVELL